MGMGIWNIADGDKVTVHYTHSTKEPPPDKWTVRIGEMGLNISTAKFDELLRAMQAARHDHEQHGQEKTQ